MSPPQIRRAADLVTPHEQVCAGFLEQAEMKATKATPYVAQAKALHDEIATVNDIVELAHKPEIRLELLAAAGFSEKAMSHLSTAELETALESVLNKIKDESGDDWRQEIVYRYLLTKGDTLGGSMRNYTGALGAKKLCSALIRALCDKNMAYETFSSPSNAEKIQMMKWRGRILVFDKTPQFLGNNIDVILLKALTSKEDPRQIVHDPAAFIACGEVKGGIDPAGADEHWKTANTGLGRIRSSFKDNRPKLFFAAAAIEAAMAEEIISQLKNGDLDFAANLTKAEQLAALAAWLVSL
ncbi:MAG: hypothetical protein KatS3mg109_1689 [Pirellulaceae bacterium]|nr:MAG: hypothetical protein KatS3mg109_1689 [Pirellulaceae bacterium]